MQEFEEPKKAEQAPEKTKVPLIVTILIVLAVAVFLIFKWILNSLSDLH